MLEAFLWGAVGASALLIGALIAYVATPSPKVIAVVMALGAGLLIGSVAFELIDEAIETTEVARVRLFTLIGAATFVLGNWVLDKRGAATAKTPKVRKRRARRWRSCSVRSSTGSPSPSCSD